MALWRVFELKVGGGVFSPFGESVGLRPRTNHAAFLFTTSVHTAKRTGKNLSFLLVGGGGFEPPKSETSDLQSDAFGHSAIRPNEIFTPQKRGKCGAGDWNRTHNLLITNQLLCQLSYTSKSARLGGALGWNRTADIWIFSPPLYQLSYQGVNALRR